MRTAFCRTLLGAFALVVVLFTAVPAQAQQVIKMTAAAGHPPVFLWVKTLDEVFIPEVDKRLAAAGGKYKIEWTRAYGGTLVKLGNESTAMKDGISDVGFVATIFEASKFPLQNVSYYAPFGSDDIAVVTNAIADLQKRIPAMNDAWGKNGLVYLGGAALDSYHLFAKFPVARYEDLQGKKINAPGPSANWVKNTGAVGVAGNLNTYYEDIKSGVSDGALTFATGAWSVKLQEVAPYIVKVNFGSQYAGGIAVNKRRFDRLPKEVQKAFVEAGQAYSTQFAKAQTELASQRMQEMVKAGGKIIELSDAERKRWADALPPIGKIWGAEMQAKGLPATEVLRGYMDALKKAGAKLPRDWAD
ncbi:MAG: C4-dicarboxylate TRAP transporter substrate-binding protein [Burkholderiales bacterium]|nr:C4-dicarboxylate TRAP transporter substrate-binding protein [Burkholderiales bacterium]